MRFTAVAVLACVLSLAPSLSAAPIQWPIAEGGNGHYYDWITGSPMSWYDANQAAQIQSSQGSLGHLLTLTSQAELDFVQANLLNHSRDLWLGGFQDRNATDYSEPAGGWRWVTGEPFAFTAWSTRDVGGNDNEPNDHGGREDFMSTETSRFGGNSYLRWNDFPISQLLGGYYVEYPAHEPSLPGSGWEAILPPGLEDYVDVVDNGTDLIDGDLVNFLTITADFTQGPSNGRFPSIPIAFRQTHEDAAEYLVIEEQINFNSSGADWDGFEFTLAGGGDPVFDLAKTEASGGPAPIGYSVAPFTSAQFTDDNTRLALSAGRVADGDVWFPGAGENDGRLWIDVTPGPDGDFTNFSFLQRPAAVPEPGTMPMLVVGLAIVLLRRSPK